MKEVAIITRTKNRPQFLRRAIRSVAQQTIKDYVHVIVNDGGNKDEVEEVVNSQTKDINNQIKVYDREEPSNGPDIIFNESIDRVDSKYVVIHDDDDTWHPQFLEKTLPVLDDGAKGVVVRTDRVYETASSKSIKPKKTEHYMPEMVSISLYRQLIDNQLTPISFIYNRNAYKEVGKYDSSLPVAGDWEFGIRFLIKYDVQYLDPGFPLAFYHERTNIKDNSFSEHSHLDNVTKIMNKYLRDELESGSLGVGYIMNKLFYDRGVRIGLIKKALPKFLVNRYK